MDLASAAHELYGVPPAEFMDTRRRLVAEARAAGDAALARRIGALHKPTVSAWAVNRLSRAAGGDLAMLLDLGARLRAAWAAGEPIGGLEQRRGEIVAMLLRTAERLAADAGLPLRDQIRREVEDTLQAAAVDPRVAEEVRIGTLDRPRSHAGFVPAGFTAPARPAAPPEPGPEVSKKQRAEEERRRREEAAEAARREADKAAKEAAEWAAEVAEAQRELDERAAEADELRRRLDRALERRRAAERRVEVARREHTRASRAAEDARRRAEGR
ncbi:hypothetical protein [Thermomonospora amylolytica]|uniref:hypothetical protein n=1 Tax=Thermomonospora amylolytica TaxID=1411117 RepID=UPI000E6D336C|nr:hypothetical protein [Thermomonospora amylolytica]